MKATITSIELKSPLNFFSLSWQARKIMQQLENSGHLDLKKRGAWKKHYTMTLWPDEEKMKKFAGSGAHLEAMKKSREIAREIRTITIDTEELPSWEEARELLGKGKVIVYS
ncbi:DUF3291 domain-containing protein [Christiangramia crocea]|uniref:DUF3291 domain-containing protein n=1 Tax=Christiangramia crocea TaxID=2904124 RepID=A0A9X1UWJ5_9FLAO|nr:DUF3291 domain-containing protein [Gramella crocea]MCG9970588.1 DUF3291 domain-containing protein [Gramella crocea]